MKTKGNAPPSPLSQLIDYHFNSLFPFNAGNILMTSFGNETLKQSTENVGFICWKFDLQYIV